jgi:hypothetical protein
MFKRICIASLALVLAASVYASDRPASQRSGQAAAAMHDDFPFTVAFEQGATKFERGDEIIVTDVRGTSSDMGSGICRISGTYTLASHDRATLAGSMTARNLADGRGRWNKAQTMTIAKGHGTFTLYLPVSVDGWPHISFYGESSDFGGSYIGTGDSVLRHWWGS